MNVEFVFVKMSTEKKKDTCVGEKGKNGKQKCEKEEEESKEIILGEEKKCKKEKKRKKEKKEEEKEDREMILGEEHWKRWQERNKTPFVSFLDYGFWEFWGP